jgi:hypothetical protein
METDGRTICRTTGIETARADGNVENCPMAEYPRGSIRVLDDEDKALGSIRHPGPFQRW